MSGFRAVRGVTTWRGPRDEPDRDFLTRPWLRATKILYAVRLVRERFAVRRLLAAGPVSGAVNRLAGRSSTSAGNCSAIGPTRSHCETTRVDVYGSWPGLGRVFHRYIRRTHHQASTDRSDRNGQVVAKKPAPGSYIYRPYQSHVASGRRPRRIDAMDRANSLLIWTVRHTAKVIASGMVSATDSKKKKSKTSLSSACSLPANKFSASWIS